MFTSSHHAGRWRTHARRGARWSTATHHSWWHSHHTRWRSAHHARWRSHAHWRHTRTCSHRRCGDLLDRIICFQPWNELANKSFMLLEVSSEEGLKQLGHLLLFLLEPSSVELGHQHLGQDPANLCSTIIMSGCQTTKCSINYQLVHPLEH